MICLTLFIVFVNVLSAKGQIDSRNVVEYLRDNNFTTLVSLIGRAGLANALATGGPISIFAPTDEAFNNMPKEVLDNIQGDPSALKDLLQLHVTAGIAITPMFTNGSTFTMLNNKTLNFRKYANNATVANGVLIPPGDVIVRNGVIHKIDRVLLPLEKSISEYVGEHDKSFQDLYAALVLEGLEPALESGNYTVFAPTDQAFTKILQALPVVTADDQTFKNILMHHVVPGVYFSAGLTNGMKLQTLAGDTLTVAINSKGVFIDGAKVLSADAATTNGVVHTIEEVLTPPSS